MEAALPYQLGIVRLVEDVFFFTRLFGNGPEALSVGAPVELRFRVLELGMELPVFVEA